MMTQHTFLTHWGRVTHICVSKLTIIGSDNGLLPDWGQAIIWTNGEILLIRPLGTSFSEIVIGIYTFSFKKMHLKMSSAKGRLFCLSLNELSDTESFIIVRCNPPWPWPTSVLVSLGSPALLWRAMTGHGPTGLQGDQNKHHEVINKTLLTSFYKSHTVEAIVAQTTTWTVIFLQNIHEDIHTCQGYPGYFQVSHWKSMGLLEISRVTWQLWTCHSLSMTARYGACFVST